MPGMLGLVENPNRFGAAVLITGPESLLAERAVAEFIEQAAAQRPDAAVVQVESAGLDAGSLAEATGGSLFATDTIAVIRDVAEMPNELFDAVVNLASSPGPDLALAIVHGGGVKGKGLLDRLKKLRIEVQTYPALKPRELPQFVINEARRLDGKATSTVAHALIQAVGTDTRVLAGAVRQLLDDAPDAVLTEASIHRYFAGRAEVTSFAVADDALNGRAEQALSKLRWALVTGVPPVMVTSAMASNLRGLGKYLDRRDSRARDVDVASSIGVPPWKLKDLSKLSRDWTAPAVGHAIQAVAVADAQIKGAGSDPGFALEQLVLSVIGQRRVSRR